MLKNIKIKVILCSLIILVSSQAYAMRFINYKSLDAVTITATSSPISASYLTSFSLQVVSTSTLAGTVKIQASNDPVTPIGGVPVNFTDIAGASILVSTGGSVLLTATATTYNWLRTVFTTSGGSGTVTTQFQGIGGF